MPDMDSWGVTTLGFYRPTFEEIVIQINKMAKEIFGEDFETSELTPQGKIIRIIAAMESKGYETDENVYYSIFPSTSRGISLDRNCEYVNLARENANRASHTLRVYGKQNYTIAAGTLFKNTVGIEFYSTKDTLINQTETGQNETVVYYGDVIVECTQSGTIGNVTNINATKEVNTNIDSVTYQNTLAYGTEIESDPELREKFSKVVQGLGTNTRAAIKANVLRLSGVNDVIIIDNHTDTDDVISSNLTVSAKSYAVIVHSDDMTIDENIAAAIFEKQPLGIMQSGIKSIAVKDDAGINHTIKFSYVEPVDVNVTVNCIVDSTFPSNGISLIKENITVYINNLGIGDEVIYSRLYDYIYNVTGVYKINNITLNNDTADITISKINIAKAKNITVTVTEV